MSEFPIHALSPAGCEWEGWHRKKNNACLELRLSGKSVQVAYGNKDYMTGCLFLAGCKPHLAKGTEGHGIYLSKAKQ